MKKVLLVLGIVALMGGSVLAEGRFEFDDSNFDYFASDDGFVSIDFSDGVFTLSLSENAVSDAATEVSDIDFLPLDEDTNFNQASMRRYLPIEVTSTGASIFYEDATLEDIMVSYDEQFTGLGFSSSVEKALPNQSIMLYEHGDTVARVVFTRQGEDVKVALNAL